MNPLEISDTLNFIVEHLIHPQNLLVNHCMLYQLYNHPDIIFIRSYKNQIFLNIDLQNF